MRGRCLHARRPAHLILPALTLALYKLALVIRLAHAGTREALLQDYVRFARAKGLPRRRIIGVHVLKNIMIPIVTVIGLELGSMIAFAVVTETVFAWPGMGKLLIDSIYRLDRPVVVAYLLVIVVMFIVINLVVDILYSAARSARAARRRRRADAWRTACHRRRRDRRELPPEPVAPGDDRARASCGARLGASARVPAPSLGLAVLVALVVIALFAPWIAPQNPYDLAQLDIMDNSCRRARAPRRPASTGSAPTTRAATCSRRSSTACASSLLVGVIAVVIALAIGAAVGCSRPISAAASSTLLMRIVDIQLSFPAILIALILLAVLGKGVDKIVDRAGHRAVGVLRAHRARLRRWSRRGKEYIEAARCLALPTVAHRLPPPAAELRCRR